MARSGRSWLRRNGLTVALLAAAAGVWFASKELKRPTAPPSLIATVPATAYTDGGTTVAPVLGEPSAAPRLVEFYTDECPACRAMAGTVETLESEAVGAGFELLTINLSERRNEHLAIRYQLRGVPTFSLLDSHGKETGRFEGVVGLRALRRAARAMVTGTVDAADGSG